MKQENKEYEKWLSEIKSRQPILDNPEQLTMTILNQITETPSEKRPVKFLIGAWVSGIAATLLLLLFINDLCLPPSSPETKTLNEYPNWINGTPPSLPNNWEEMKLPEKNAYLSSRYAQHRKLRQTQIFQTIKENQSK